MRQPTMGDTVRLAAPLLSDANDRRGRVNLGIVSGGSSDRHPASSMGQERRYAGSRT